MGVLGLGSGIRVISYQTAVKKFLPRPEWSLHCPASLDRGCRESDPTPPCQSAQLSVLTTTAPEGAQSIHLSINRWKYTSHIVTYSMSCSIYLVLWSPDGRTALELRGPCRDVLSTQAEVVVGGLHRQRGPGLPRRLDQVQTLCRGQMNNVAPHPGAEKGRWRMQPNPIQSELLLCCVDVSQHAGFLTGTAGRVLWHCEWPRSPWHLAWTGGKWSTDEGLLWEKVWRMWVCVTENQLCE